MVFPRVAVFSVGVFFICKISILEAQQCETCQIRDFSEKIPQKCTCPENHYCNISSSRCSKCDSCYDGWNNAVKKNKADFETILKELLKKYEVNLGDLKKLLKTLTDSITKSENELKRIKMRGDQIDKKIPKVNNDLKKLKKDIQEVQEKLKKLGDPLSIQDVTNYLTEVINVMRNILEKLKKLNLDYDDIKELDLAKLKNIEDQIKKMNQNFPKIEKDSLNLATSLESDIDLLESIVLKPEDDKTFRERFGGLNIEEDTNWMEKDLLWLFSLLNTYGNISLDTQGLLKNASNVRSSAQLTDSKLRGLLKRHGNFEQLLKNLKNETEFYQELDRLLKRLKNLDDKIKEFEELMKILRQKLKLSHELDEFFMERDAFDRKELNLRKYKSKLEKLYQEKTQLVQKYNEIVIPTDEIQSDLMKMEDEAREIRREVEEHCSSSIIKKI